MTPSEKRAYAKGYCDGAGSTSTEPIKWPDDVKAIIRAYAKGYQEGKKAK